MFGVMARQATVKCEEANPTASCTMEYCKLYLYLKIFEAEPDKADKGAQPMRILGRPIVCASTRCLCDHSVLD